MLSRRGLGTPQTPVLEYVEEPFRDLENTKPDGEEAGCVQAAVSSIAGIAEASSGS